MPELSVVGPAVVVLVELGAEEEVVDSPLVVRDISDRELIVSTCTAPENWTIDPRLAGAPVAREHRVHRADCHRSGVADQTTRTPVAWRTRPLQSWR